jgi:hypothetical protein
VLKILKFFVADPYPHYPGSTAFLTLGPGSGMKNPDSGKKHRSATQYPYPVIITCGLYSYLKIIGF